MISISKVAYGYEKDSIVVRNLDFAIDKGRIYGLLGKNGSGKTTLLKLLCGEIFPKKGKITADGRDAAERETETLGNIFFIPAEFGFGHLSLDKFIRLHSPFYSSSAHSESDDVSPDPIIPRSSIPFRSPLEIPLRDPKSEAPVSVPLPLSKSPVLPKAPKPTPTLPAPISEVPKPRLFFRLEPRGIFLAERSQAGPLDF